MRMLKFSNMQEFPSLFDKEKIFNAVPMRFYNESSADDIAKVVRTNSDTITVTFHTGDFTILDDYKIELEKCVPKVNDVALFDFKRKTSIFISNNLFSDKLPGWSMIPDTKKAVIIATPFENKDVNAFYRISTHGGMASWPVIIYRLRELIPSLILPTNDGLLLAIELICGRHGIDIPSAILTDDLNKISTLLALFFGTSEVKPKIKTESLTELLKIMDSTLVLGKEIKQTSTYLLSQFIGLNSLPQVQWQEVKNDLDIIGVTAIHLQNGRLFFDTNDMAQVEKSTQTILSTILQIDKNKIVICRKVSA